jgi:hypothetical protein
VAVSFDPQPLFEPEMTPEMAASILKVIEDVRFDPAKLAEYEEKFPDGRAFLDFVIAGLGGRSQ